MKYLEPPSTRGFPRYEPEANLTTINNFARWIVAKEPGRWDLNEVTKRPSSFYHEYHQDRILGKKVRSRMMKKIRHRNFIITRASYVSKHNNFKQKPKDLRQVLNKTAASVTAGNANNQEDRPVPSCPPKQFLEEKVERLMRQYFDLTSTAYTYGGVEFVNYLHHKVVIPGFTEVQQLHQISTCQHCDRSTIYDSPRYPKDGEFETALRRHCYIPEDIMADAENHCARQSLRLAVPREGGSDPWDQFDIGLNRDIRDQLRKMPHADRQEYFRFIESMVKDITLPKRRDMEDQQYAANESPLDYTAADTHHIAFLATARRSTLRAIQTEAIQYFSGRHNDLTSRFGNTAVKE